MATFRSFRPAVFAVALLAAAAALVTYGVAIAADSLGVHQKAKHSASVGTLELKPRIHDFGKVMVSSSSAPATVTATNISKSASINFTSIVAKLPFKIQSDGCSGAPLAAGKSCKVDVVFHPTATGKVKDKDALTFTDSAKNSPQYVELEGQGVTATAVFNTVFVTSTTFDGDLGGQDGADDDCAAAAKAVGLSGTFKAWLSTSKRNAKDKLGTARGFVRVDGQPFADQVSDIVAGTIFNPLDIDENGDVHPDSPNPVWTGTLGAGTVATQTCSDWTSNFFEVDGDTGVSSFGPTFWTDNLGNIGNSCDSAQSLYCFDTSHVTPLTVIKTPGRIGFVSKGTLDNTSGIAGADTLCATEASAASLPGTFQALLSTSTTPAAMRSGFDFSAMSAPYVRPDGIKIADAPTIASGAPLDSGIWQNADATYVATFNFPWTGSSTPPSSTTTAQTCDDWSTNSDSVHGDVGETRDSGEFWWSGDGATEGCGGSSSIYCLQE